MDISSQKVVSKIEELLKRAKASESEERLEGCILAIHALCELLLDEKKEAGSPLESYQPSSKAIVNETVISPIQPSYSQQKPVKINDANGDSLFDF